MLLFNESPIHWKPSIETLSLEVLPMIGTRCHSLRHLAIFVDATATEVPLSSHTSAADDSEPLFRNLQYLDFGLSCISRIIGADSLSMWLSGIIPPTCTLLNTAPIIEASTNTCHSWPDISKEVVRLTGLLSAARKEERMKCEARQCMLEERIRVLELSGKNTD